jgi:hypothetical protein
MRSVSSTRRWRSERTDLVHIALPPPTISPTPVFRDLPAGSRLVRIFDPLPHNTQALTFRRHGPLARFDHHRPPVPRKRSVAAAHIDPGRGIYYCAVSLSCCLVEVFGDYRLIDNPDLLIAFPETMRTLRLLDLTGAGAMRAGSVASLCATADRNLSQVWSRYFYETAAFQPCDGLMYHSAHNNEHAIALYERAENALACPSSQVISIADPRLRPVLVKIATEHGMDLAI